VAYTGQALSIACGLDGLKGDDNSQRLPPTALLLANNVILHNGITEKAPGARRWNKSQLAGGGVVALTDFWPDDITQRRIVVMTDGRVYKLSDPETAILIASGLTISDPPVFVAGGAESQGRDRKLFLFTGNNPVMVLSGDGTTMTAMSQPAADWTATTTYPVTGLIHRSRLAALGARGAPHVLYLSDPDDHEKFTGGNAFDFTVYPGESETLFSAYVYKGVLFVFKHPEGAYYLVDTDPDFVNWSIQRLTASFGAASSHAAIEVLNDMIVANSTGSLTSATATQELGGITSGDILRTIGCERFMRQNMSQDGRVDRHAIYYENKKVAMFTYRSSSAIENDRILMLDFNAQVARVTWLTFAQANCLTLVKDTQRVLRPYYGSNDGFIYEMDRNTREVTQVEPPGLLTATIVAGSELANGTYSFRVTFAELADTTVGSEPSPAVDVTIVASGTFGRVQLSLPVDPSGTATSRKIWMKLPLSDSYDFLDEVADNTTTSYTVLTTPPTFDPVPTENTFALAYTGEFKTPAMDFGFVDPGLSERRKLFDHLEVTFEETGNWNLSVDVFIDKIFVETIDFTLTKGEYLNNFSLDNDQAVGRTPQSVMKPLHGTGRRISFRCYNSGLRQNFKLSTLTVYFRVAGNDQGAQTS